jgi:hypothetical protein
MSSWLVVPLVLLAAWLWITGRTLARTRRRLDEAESRLARRFYRLQGRLTEMDATVRELDFERRRRRGEIRFEPETKLRDALAVHPKVREILAAFGLTGEGCSGGGLDESASLAEACRDNGLDAGDVLAALARFVEAPDTPVRAQPSAAKLHRIGKSI